MSEQETVLPGATETLPIAPAGAQEVETAHAKARAEFDKIIGKSKAKAKAEADPEPEKTEETPAEAPLIPVKRTKIDRMREKLENEGFSKKALAGLDEDELFDLQEREEQRNEAVRSIHRELEDLKSSKPAEKAPEPKPEVDPFAAIIAELSETFGEDEAKKLAGAFKTVLSSRDADIAALKEENASFKGIIERAQKTNEQQLIEDNRARLSERLPILEDNDKAWGAIEGAVRAAFKADPKAYESAEDAFDDIFDALYGEIARPGVAKKDEETEDLKDAIGSSAPNLPQKTASNAQRLSPLEKARKVYKHILKNPGDVAGAQKAARI